MSVTAEDLCLLYEDEHIIVVDKPSNILSVPGKGAKPFVKFRCDQWQDAIVAASVGDFGIAEYSTQQYMIELASMNSIPRKEARFYGFLSRTLKIEDKDIQKNLWTRICALDVILNRQAFEDIPNHLVSTADLVEKHCGHKVYTVHRLDMETSGIILFCKTEDSSAELARQFREREVIAIIFSVELLAVPSLTLYHRCILQLDRENILCQSCWSIRS